MQSPAASASDYYLRLGLASDPFAIDAMPEFFFVGAQRRFLVQRAVHALYFSGSTVLLLGADGVGKTRTLTEIEKDLKDLADICRIEASVLMHAGEIRALIAAALGLPSSVAVGNAELVYALERIRPADGDPQPVLLAIDAAQLLSIETLAETAALVAGAGGRLRLLLAGEADLHIAWQQAQAGAAEILELKPLDRNETEDYVRTKIQAAGYREENLLSNAAFDHLYEQSGGNFAIINAFAPQLLQPQPEAASITQRVRQLPLIHIVVATIILAVVILLVLYRGSHSESSQIQLAQPAEIAQPISGDKKSGDKKSGEKKSDEKKKGVATVTLQLPTSPSASNVAQETISPAPSVPSSTNTPSTPANTLPITAEKNVATAAPNAVENKLIEKSVAQDKATPKKETTIKVEPPVKPEAPTKAEVEPAAPNKSAARNDAQALLAMPSSHYVLQLIGAESKTTVDKFAKGAGKGLKLYVYHTKLRGKPWIIVVTGPYADKNAAMAGAEKLPEAIRKQQPWPRTLANVQADIRAHNGR